MATNREPQDQAPGADPVGPGDVPAERPQSLDRLDALTGQWDMEATFEAGSFGPGSPAMTARGGRTTFAWLEGRFFLTQRFITEHPAAPSGIAIIGAGTQPDTFTQHYYDSRGVARVYQMTLDGGVWKLGSVSPSATSSSASRPTADPAVLVRTLPRQGRPVPMFRPAPVRRN